MPFWFKRKNGPAAQQAPVADDTTVGQSPAGVQQPEPDVTRAAANGMAGGVGKGIGTGVGEDIWDGIKSLFGND
ncbi:hypothetical protein ACFVZ3_19495 [Kitasatospora purpeofusca]|uniref:hypothetical protein n=1 Tax=Kitasatospora purpeofusca TaxID=67352 RepID=UPI0036A277D2